MIKVDLRKSQITDFSFPFFLPSSLFPCTEVEVTDLAPSHDSVISSRARFLLHIPSDAGSLQLGHTLFESSHDRIHCVQSGSGSTTYVYAPDYGSITDLGAERMTTVDTDRSSVWLFTYRT